MLPLRLPLSWFWFKPTWKYLTFSHLFIASAQTQEGVINATAVMSYEANQMIMSSEIESNSDQ